MVTTQSDHRHFFTDDQTKRIFSAIRDAESKTSGEIVVHLQRKSKGPVLEHAKKVFHRLGMTRKKHRNGVLLFIAVQDRRIAILGDRGIHERVSERFWEECLVHMREAFVRQDFLGGTLNAIAKIGAELSKHFPAEKGDANQLPDID